MNIRSISSANIIRDIYLQPTNKIYSSSANEAEVETIFEEYLKEIGYSIGKSYTKRTAKSKSNKFISKSGSGSGYPDYIFYDNGNSSKIIAIGEAKSPDIKGGDNSVGGLNECINDYLCEYNSTYKEKIKIAFGFDGINFKIKYLDEKSNKWKEILIDNNAISVMPEPKFLSAIYKYGNIFSTQVDKSVSKELLNPYFAQCDTVFRMARSSLSAIDKASEISIFIFLKIFSNDMLDESFKKETGQSVWGLLEDGKITMVNRLFREFLNEKYENIFPEKLVKVDSESAKSLANIINSMFEHCDIGRMTDVKGNALEYYQKDSKDKKIGEFFTPRHLIDLMVFLTSPSITFTKNSTDEYKVDKFGNRIIKNIETIYDPACGSGGFLIQSFLYYINKYNKYGVNADKLKRGVIFGNELKDSTVMLTKLNMILLGDGHNNISNENALSYKKINKLEKVKDDNGNFIEINSKSIDFKEQSIGEETIVLPFEKNTNNPVIQQKSKNKIKYYRAKIKLQKDGFSPEYDFVDIKAVNDKVRDYHKKSFGNFDIVMANHPYGIEEPQKPDELFITHMIEATKNGGRIACIVGEKILFDKNYKKFRLNIINNYTVEAIISLPQGVFNPYTDVKTSVLLIKKERAKKHHKTWFVELLHDGFDLNRTRKPIDVNDIPKIKKLWEKWGGYTIENESGEQEFKSFHKEEIGFAEFHTIKEDNWCVKRYNTPLVSLKSKHSLVKISDILIKQKNIIDIQDDTLYQRLTIQVKNRGVVPRDSVFGSEIGTKKQFLVEKGEFIISKIDARNGAYGIIPKELDGAIITGNFWTYKINTDKVIPDFLTYLMRHEFFNQMCNICSYGSTNRWYLDEKTFNNFKLPLPDKKEQKKILLEIKKETKKIENYQKKINENNNNILNIIENIVT